MSIDVPAAVGAEDGGGADVVGLGADTIGGALVSTAVGSPASAFFGSLSLPLAITATTVRAATATTAAMIF